VPEVTRALRALSSAYVQRRHKVAAGATLDSAGKRAAFALFYGPLHLLTVWHVLDALGARVPPAITDLGCGTGVAGTAWALRSESPAHVLGHDRHPWAIEESRWTYRQFGLQGSARVSDVGKLAPVGPKGGVVAAYLLNELTGSVRSELEARLLAAGGAGAPVLIIEPIARSITPWWDQTADRFRRAGGRADEWRFPIALPPAIDKFDRAAGLRHTELTARTLAINL
jgi:hypothetical protein